MQRDLGFRELAGDPQNRNQSGVDARDRFRVKVCRMRP